MPTYGYSGIYFPAHAVFETVRGEKDPRTLMFAVWDGVKVSTVPYLERDLVKIYPPEAKLSYADRLHLPTGVAASDLPGDLFDDLGKTISEFFDLTEEGLLVLRAQILNTWHPPQDGVVLYLWVVGPFASGRSNLLRLLLRLCRHAINIADVGASSLHKFIRHGDTTLLFDEFDPGSARCQALYPLLRAGSLPDGCVARTGDLNSVYCPKIFASRQLPGDAALESRTVVIEMFRATKKLRPLNQSALDQIGSEYQNRLLTYRFMKALQADRANLPTKDLEQSLEPEWLVVETLFDLCHDRKGVASMCEFTFGGIADHLNSRLQSRGESFGFTAKKIGLVVRGLAIRPIPLGNQGNGLRLTCPLKEQVHKLPRQFSIDRRSIGFSGGLEAGYGGVPCELCERFGVTGGLKFAAPSRPRVQNRPRRPSLLDPAFRDAEAKTPAKKHHRRTASRQLA